MSLPTINGYTLLSQVAQWSDLPAWTLKWDTEVAPTVRGNEGRSALREAPRPVLSYKVQPLSIEPQARLMAALTAGLATGKCCAPTWGRASWLAADAAAGTNTLQIEPTPWAWAVGDFLLIYTPDGGYQTAQIGAVDATRTVLTTTAALPSACAAATAVYPLFFGRPEVSDIDQTNGSISAATITLTGEKFAVASAVAAANYLGRPVFGFRLDWSQGVTRRLTYDLRTQQIGFGAEVDEQLQSYTADGYSVGLSLLTPCDVNALERFFAGVYGRMQGFWLPSPAWQCDIVATVSASEFLVKNAGLADAIGNLPALHLFLRPDGAATGEAAQVMAVASLDADTEKVTLAAPLTSGVPDATWVAQRLLYVRLSDDDISLDFVYEGRATTSLQLLELPVEYASVELGDRPAFAYHFWRQVGNLRRDWYFTSFDRQLFVGTVQVQHVCTPAPISHAEITRTTAGDREELQINSWRFDGSPLEAYIPFAPQYDLFVEVWEVDLASGQPEVATTVFAGMVDTVEPSGRALKVTCTTRLDRLNSKIPRFRVQKSCNYCLYGVCCKVQRADYSVAAQVVSVVANGRSLVLAAAGLTGKPANWFQFGDAEATDAEGLPIYRTIIASAPGASADQQTINLAETFNPPPAVGDVVVIAAGCDLQYDSDQGCGKFHNKDNFGGHPHIAENLVLKAIPMAKNPGGGK